MGDEVRESVSVNEGESLRKKEPERMRMLNREVRMSEMRALKTKETTIFNR